jgi:uncharacterized protein
MIYRIQFLVYFLFTLLGPIGFAQSTSSTWQGKLSVGAQQLRLVVHLNRNGETCSATFDSPDQMAMGIPFSSCQLRSDSLLLLADALQAAFLGRFMGDSIIGEWSQGGRRFPLILFLANQNEIIQKGEYVRPQSPKPPFPYVVREIKFSNTQAEIELSGTLSMPEGYGPFPALVLVSGSGPQDRDETILGHKPFAVIADFLTRKGYAVLRYDDRGVGASTGQFKGATTQDFASDANSAWKYLNSLPEVDKSKVGVIGHSEGGIVAAMLASTNRKCAFVVSMAGTGIPHDQVLLEQANALYSSASSGSEDLAEVMAFNKSCYDVLKQEKSSSVREARIRKLCYDYFELGNADYPEGKKAAGKQAEIMIQVLLEPWFLYFIQMNPATYWSKVKCPVLAMNGELDLQVLPVSNLRGIQKALPKRTKIKSCFIELNKLNHLFQPAVTGRPEEYGTIQTSISESALNLISDWLIKEIQ